MPLKMQSPGFSGRVSVAQNGLEIPFSAQEQGWLVVEERKPLAARLAALILRGRRTVKPEISREAPSAQPRQFHVESMKAAVHPRFN